MRVASSLMMTRYKDQINAAYMNQAKMMEQSSTKDNPDGAISKRFALTYGLCLNDEEYARNKKWLKQENAEAAGESTGEEEDDAGAAGGGAASPIPGGLG